MPVGRSTIQPPRWSSSPSITPSAMNVSSPRREQVGHDAHGGRDLGMPADLARPSSAARTGRTSRRRCRAARPGCCPRRGSRATSGSRSGHKPKRSPPSAAAEEPSQPGRQEDRERHQHQAGRDAAGRSRTRRPRADRFRCLRQTGSSSWLSIQSMRMKPGKTVMKNNAATAMPGDDEERRLCQPRQAADAGPRRQRLRSAARRAARASPPSFRRRARSAAAEQGGKTAQPGASLPTRRIVLQDGVGIDHRLAAHATGPSTSIPCSTLALPMCTAMPMLAPVSTVSRSGARR